MFAGWPGCFFLGGGSCMLTARPPFEAKNVALAVFGLLEEMIQKCIPPVSWLCVKPKLLSSTARVAKMFAG